MEYKTIHTSDLQADLNTAAAQGWELFSDPIPYRQPGRSELWLVVMERGRPDDEAQANAATLQEIRDWQGRNVLGSGAHTEHSRGYQHALQDLGSILAVHGQPPGVAIVFRPYGE